MKRYLAPLSLSLVAFVGLVGCSSTSSTLATQTSTSPPSDSVSGTPSEAPLPSGATSPSPVIGGTATDYCGAFKELETVTQSASGDAATVGAKLQSAAADMRKYAPAEIQQAANTYADVMESVGKAAASGSYDKTTFSQAISKAISGNAKDIGKVGVWVARNCQL